MSDHAPITPVPLPMRGERTDPSVRTVLLFGGSFDPPHKGHITLPLLAARHLERSLDQERGVHILYVPAARSPHKAQRPGASDAQRLEMLRLAVGHLPRCAVWSDEVDRARPGEPSFTVDTVRRLRSWLDAHGGEDVRVRLLIGADQAAALGRWREPGAVVALAEPLVMQRAVEGARVGAGQPATAAFPPSLGPWERRVLPIPALEASSTAVREALAGNDGAGDEAALRRLVDAPVLAYIRSAGLYLA